MSMSPLTVALLVASILQSLDAQRAAERISQADYCDAVERRAQHREIEPVQPTATPDVNTARDLSREEREQLRQALDRLAHCATGKMVYDRAAGFYVPEQKEGCR